MSNERNFSDTYARLNEIADEISNTDISLDEALSLYEEAVSLGLEACDLSEQDIFVDEDASEPSGLAGAGDMPNESDASNASSQNDSEANGIDSANTFSDKETPIPQF